MMMMILVMMMKMNISITQSIFKLGPPYFSWKQIYIIPTICFIENDDNDNDDDDNDDKDDEDYYSFNSVNFQVRTSRFCMKVNLHNTSNIILIKTSRFCMEVDLHNTYNMILMKMMIMRMIMMIMMMKMIIAITQSIFKLGPPDFLWKQIQIIPTI